MIKRILILGILVSLIQTSVYFIFAKLLQYAEISFVVEKQRQITNSAMPYIILVFFETVLIQNILTSMVNKKIFTWIMFSLSTLFLLAGWLEHFSIWPSLPFTLIIVLLLSSVFFANKYYQKIN